METFIYLYYVVLTMKMEDVFELVNKAKEYLARASSAEYEDFWDSEEWGKPTELYTDGVDLLKRIDNFVEAVRQYAKEHGTSNPQGEVLEFQFAVSYKVAPNEHETEGYTKYIPVTKEVKKAWNELVELRNKIKEILTENRFIE